jgi:hypothetical protein
LSPKFSAYLAFAASTSSRILVIAFTPGSETRVPYTAGLSQRAERGAPCPGNGINRSGSTQAAEQLTGWRGNRPS